MYNAERKIAFHILDYEFLWGRPCWSARLAEAAKLSRFGIHRLPKKHFGNNKIYDASKDIFLLSA